MSLVWRGPRPINTLLAIALVALSALPSSAEPTGAAAPEVHWRLIGPQLQVLAGEGPLTVPESDWERFTHAWVWTEGRPPRKIPIDQLRRNQPIPLPPSHGEAGASGDTLTVRLEGLPPRRSGPAVTADSPPEWAKVIAAPLAMWYEVPESSLPTIGVPASGRLTLPWDPTVAWRVRGVAPTLRTPLGSWWREVPASPPQTVDLLLQPASDVEITLLDDQGEPVDGAWLRSFPVPGSRTFNLHRAVEGEVVLPLVPDSRALSVAAMALGFLDAYHRAFPSRLPPRLTLHPGARLTGRFVDDEGSPVGGVEVIAEGWLAGPPATAYRSRTTSGEDGGFSVAPVPLGRITLHAAHPAFAAVQKDLELAPAETEGLAMRAGGSREEPSRWTLDLGALALRAGVDLRVRVEDPYGEPVPGARIRTQPALGEALTTDPRGEALLRGVDPREPLEWDVRARGFLPGSGRSLPPHEPARTVSLEPAFLLTGRFVGPEGRPVGDGTVLARSERLLTTEALEPDGGFELTLLPDTEYRLRLRGPGTGELTRAVEPGQPGEVRDLGDLEAPPGRTLIGRLISEAGGEPVPDARISAPRPNGEPAMRSWFFGDLLETRSDAEGRFRLRGLGELPARVRIEATGFARTERTVTPNPEDPVTDLGTLELQPGGTLRVEVDGFDSEDPRPMIARLDPGRRWQERDMLTAPVHEGVATLPDLPPGAAILTVLRGDDLVCEQDVEIPSDGEPRTARCRAQPIRVEGRVLLGRTPAPGGRLLWAPPSVGGSVFIRRRTSPLGVVRSQVFGNGRPDVEIHLEDGGAFTTERLRPGRWEVAWYGETGSGTAPETVVIPPDRGRFEVLLEFPEYRLEGWVVDSRGEPVPDARVHVRATGTTVAAGPDGMFEVSGLGPGQYSLRATLGQHASPWSRVEIPTHGDAEPVELILKEPGTEDGVEVRIAAVDGAPAAGAFVFVETDQPGQRLLTADPEGRLRLEGGVEAPRRIRLAVFHAGHWLLGDWRDWQEMAGETWALELPEGGRLEIRSGGESPTELSLLSADHWDVAWLLRRLGYSVTPTPEAPVEWTGLPPGVYQLQGPHGSQSITLQRNRTTEIELP